MPGFVNDPIYACQDLRIRIYIPRK